MLRRLSFQILCGATVLVVLCLLLITNVRVRCATSRLPERGTRLHELEGLSGPALIRLDTFGIAHVEAGDEGDLWFAQGYLHARDRFFQMELQRRMATGRLAEALGETAVAGDRVSRSWRLGSVARRQAGTLSPASRHALERYVAGVNAAIAAYGSWISPETGILGMDPEPWRVEDSLAIALVLQLRLSPGAAAELGRSVELARLGRTRALDLWGWTPAEARAWIPPGEPVSHPLSEDDVIVPVSAPAGSLAWALAPERTAVGRSLLAGVVHLDAGVPGPWTAIHLEAPGLSVAGATIPGSPGVLIGHTDSVAWTLGTAMLDDQDLYRLEIDPSGKRELVRGTWHTLQVTTEQVRVLGRDEPEEVVIKTSRIGPVVRERNGEVLALAWSSMEGPSLLEAVLAMNRAQDLQGLVGAWKGVSGPGLNLVAADVEGRLLQQVVGRVPIRGRGAGRLPAPGSDLRWAWSGLRPMEANPRLEGLDTGMVTAADHDPVTEGDYSAGRAYPGEFGPPWRVRRLREQLGRSTDWDLGKALELQGDLYSGRARAFLQLLGPDLDRLGGRTAASLLDWDGVMGPTSRPAFLLSRLVEELCRRVGADEAVQAGLPTTVIDSSRLLRLLAGGLDEEWWDDVGTQRVEDREEIVAAALADLDAEVPRTEWGAVHVARLVHPFARVPIIGPALGRMWGREPFQAGGDDSTLLALPWRKGSPFAVSAVPTLRFVVEVGDWDECVLSVPPGQSGRPWSSHYGDQTRAVLVPQPVPLRFSDGAVERSTVARLILTPAESRDAAVDPSP